MKTIIKILIIKILIILTIFPFSKTNAQVADTLAYVKTFEANKANYIGQPFSKLLNDMSQLQPKHLFTYYQDSSLMFCKEDDLFTAGTVNMVIFWQIPIPSTDSEYYENKNNFLFTNDERNYYNNKIVKNIYVYVTD